MRTASKQKTSHNRVLNCITSPGKEKDWNIQHAENAGILKAVQLPPAIDLRAGWWGVGNQGNTGSCVGWATADSLLRWHFTTGNRIKPKEKVSVRFIWMSSKETDEFNNRPTTFIDDAGTSLKSALNIAKKYGAVTDTVLPFEGVASKLEEENFFALASRLRISSYFNLQPSGADKLREWKKWLAFHGPILTRLEVDNTFMEVKADGKLKKYNIASANGGHAVSVVGYTDKHFIIRNSWGSGWANKGFAYASYDYAEAAFDESYGISV